MNIEIPNEYLCPISLNIMVDPVICSDGYTYERIMILNIANSISPITRELIDKTKLISNRNLKDAIERYKLVLSINRSTKPSFMSKLEEFEYEQKFKKIEFQNKLNQERLEKEKCEKEIRLQKLQEEQKNIKLIRILTMINSQNIILFTYGHFFIFQ